MSGMGNFLAGFGGGYINGMQRKQDRERQAKLDAQGQQLHEAKMQEILAAQAARQDDANFKEANRVAVSAGKTDGGYQITDAAGSNAFTKDIDAAAALGDMAATKNADVQNNAATRVSTGRAGATMQGTVAGNQVFQDPAKAQEFAKTQAMSDWAKMKARQEVADEFGKMDLSDDLRVKLLKLESEGAFNAYRLAANGDYEGAAKVYQSTGQNRLPEGAFFTSAEVEDPATKIKRRVVSVMGKDGQPIVPDLDQALRTYLSPSERYNMDKGDRTEARSATKDAQTQSNWEKEFGLKQQDRRDTANYRSAVLGARTGGGDGAQPQGIDMSVVDKTLPAYFTQKDEMTGVSSVDFEGMKFVRDMVPRMPMAVNGDSTGALLQAMTLYNKEISASKGNAELARKILARKLSRQSGDPVNETTDKAEDETQPPKLPPPKLPTQSGSHAFSSPMQTTIRQTNPDVVARLRDIDKRLQLQGIDPDVKLQLLLDRKKLTGGASDYSNFLNQR